MSNRSTSTPPPEASAIVAGLRLHAIARSELQYCEHELALLDGDGLPIVARDEVLPKLTQALHHANGLQAALVELVRQADPSGEWQLGGDTDAELREAADLLRVHGRLDEAVAFYSSIVAVVVDGQLTDAQVLQIARAIKRACAARQPLAEQHWHDTAKAVLAFLTPSVAKVATDTRFGEADTQGRVARLLDHPTTIAEVARLLAGADKSV